MRKHWDSHCTMSILCFMACLLGMPGAGPILGSVTHIAQTRCSMGLK
jgi:hypothetical protein